MKKKFASQSAFFNLRVLIGLFVFLAGVFLALLGFRAFSKAAAQANSSAPRSGPPTVVPMTGPVLQGMDLRMLPYIAPSPQLVKERLTRHPQRQTSSPVQSDAVRFPSMGRLIQLS